MDFFEFYGLEKKFFIDEILLKRLYFQKSKEFHPDFHQQDELKQEEALEMTSTNNTAYNALKSFDSRLKYILETSGVLTTSNDLPQSFLMEMMEVNEAIMEVQLGATDEDKKKISELVENKKQYFSEENVRLAKIYDNSAKDEGKEEILSKLKENYLKQKYVLRMKETLDKFAPL